MIIMIMTVLGIGNMIADVMRETMFLLLLPTTTNVETNLRCG